MWKPKPSKTDPEHKPDQNKSIVVEKTPLREQAPKVIDVADGGIWTLVNKASRAKGAGVVNAEASPSLHYLNGFETLGALNGPQGPYDRGP
ncbi:hypothetical protein QL285_007022 [Trifolium repens]|nr:hypothetical protein QL285_007022 [Trifolium repens]